MALKRVHTFGKTHDSGIKMDRFTWIKIIGPRIIFNVDELTYFPTIVQCLIFFLKSVQ